MFNLIIFYTKMIFGLKSLVKSSVVHVLVMFVQDTRPSIDNSAKFDFDFVRCIRISTAQSLIRCQKNVTI